MRTVAEKYGYTSRNAIYCEAKKRKVPIYFYLIEIRSIMLNVAVGKYTMTTKGEVLPYPHYNIYKHYGNEERCYVNYWIAWADALRINQALKRAS